MNAIAQVQVRVDVPCPPSCRWHGTQVLHGPHYDLVPRDVVTAEEACRRLGLDVAFSSDIARHRTVVFNDRRNTNHVACGGEVIYSFSSTYVERGRHWPGGMGCGIVRMPDGSHQWVTFA